MKPIRSCLAASLAAACVIAMLAAQSAPAQTFKVLYNFKGGNDGSYPAAGVIQDSKGNLYGTTSAGGGGWGTVFKLSKTGEETVLYSFKGGTDGSYPVAGVIRDSKGNLDGTTSRGGAQSAGTVFELSKGGKETVLHFFTVFDGAEPEAGVIRDAKGNLYGTTFYGGAGCVASSCGIVFRLDNTTGQETMYAFTGGADGSNPSGGVIQDAQGNLYGTTQFGGDSVSGTVFKLSKSGKETVLYVFTGGADGSGPQAGVIQDAQGNLYGTSFYGGASGNGVVFKVSKTGKETVLHSFNGGTDGANPAAGVIQDSQGNLYGTTLYGGGSNSGTVFKLSRTGKETVLHSFKGGADGANPAAGVIRDAKGNLYGTTASGGASDYGTVFKLTP